MSLKKVMKFWSSGGVRTLFFVSIFLYFLKILHWYLMFSWKSIWYILCVHLFWQQTSTVQDSHVLWNRLWGISSYQATRLYTGKCIICQCGFLSGTVSEVIFENYAWVRSFTLIQTMDRKTPILTYWLFIHNAKKGKCTTNKPGSRVLYLILKMTDHDSRTLEVNLSCSVI